MKKLLYLLSFISSFAFAQTTVRMSATATGTDTYSCLFNPNVAAFNSSTIYVIPFTNANSSGTITLDPDSGGPGAAVSIKGDDGNDLAVGAIKAGGTYQFKFNGTLLRMIGSAGGVSSFVSLIDGPGAFAGNTLKYFRVNTGGTALEYRTPAQTLADIGATSSTAIVNTFTVDHVLASTDIEGGLTGKYGFVIMNSASPLNFTLPSDATLAAQIGTEIGIVQLGDGLLTVVQGSGATVTPPDGGNLLSPGKGQAFVAKKTAANTWRLFNGNAASALTKTDDTNVTLTLGGAPSTSLLAAVSITAGWSGQLAPSRGGTGSSDFKHQRVTTGSVGAGSTALVTITWTVAFADANYSVTASVEDATTSSLSLSVVHVESKSSSAVTVRVLNNAIGSLTGTVNVIAVHD